MPYNPSLHETTNKPLGPSQRGPTDARSFFYNETTFQYEYYLDEAAVWAYLTPVKYRAGNFPIFIRRGAGNPVEEWWFKEGTNNNQLILKQAGAAGPAAAGTVLAATDAEMQITTVTPEDTPTIKVPSRVKIFNWWTWLKTQAQDGGTNMAAITGRWLFNRLGAAVVEIIAGANAAVQRAGHLWFSAGNYKVNKATTDEDIITTLTNTHLQDTVNNTERIMSANAAGGLSAAYELVEEIVTDGDIVNACMAASFTVNNGFQTSITPANGKTFYKGQRARTPTTVAPPGPYHMYFAFDDNVVVRAPLG